MDTHNQIDRLPMISSEKTASKHNEHENAYYLVDINLI